MSAPIRCWMKKCGCTLKTTDFTVKGLSWSAQTLRDNQLMKVSKLNGKKLAQDGR